MNHSTAPCNDRHTRHEEETHFMWNFTMTLNLIDMFMCTGWVVVYGYNEVTDDQVVRTGVSVT